MSGFDDSFFSEEEINSIDFDHVPDILYRWLEHESEEQQAFLHGEDLELDLRDVLDIDEVSFLLVYLCSTFEINAELYFKNGGGIILRGGEEGDMYE
jgi:hypothetical protein